ncbi:hypothetical protein Tco_0405305 [Tanacetum coccineum]
MQTTVGIESMQDELNQFGGDLRLGLFPMTRRKECYSTQMDPGRTKADHLAGSKDDYKITSEDCNFWSWKTREFDLKKQECTTMSTSEADMFHLSSCCSASYLYAHSTA